MSDNTTRIPMAGLVGAIIGATRGAVEAVAERVTGGEHVIELVGTLPVVQMETLNDEIYTRGDQSLFPTASEMDAQGLMSCKRAIQIVGWWFITSRDVPKYQFRVRVGARHSPCTLWVRKDQVEQIAAGQTKTVPGPHVTAPHGQGAVGDPVAMADRQFHASSAARRAELAKLLPADEVRDEAITVDSKWAFGSTPKTTKPTGPRGVRGIRPSGFP